MKKTLNTTQAQTIKNIQADLKAATALVNKIQRENAIYNEKVIPMIIVLLQDALDHLREGGSNE